MARALRSPYEESDQIALSFIRASLVWLLVIMLFGLTASLQFFWPELFRGIAALEFGRFRPTHSQGVLYGWLSLMMIGAWLYMVPRLTRTQLFSPKLAIWCYWLWNAATAAGIVAVSAGYTQGYEYADWPLPVDVLFVAALFLLSYNVFQTIRRRRQKSVYVSLWYMMGTLVWFSGVYLIGNTPVFTGMNQMNVNWFLGHSIVGLWFTTGILSIAYYLFPKVTGNPIWSHKLSLIGFWTIGTFYIQNGPHHLVFSSIMYWLQSWAIVMSIFMVIPLFAVLANFWGTMRGRWNVVGETVVAKYLMAGWFFYLVTCLQGPAQATRTMSAYEHFSHWVVGHAHLALAGFATSFLYAAAYYMVPLILRRELYSQRLADMQFWLYIGGVVLMVGSLTIAGLIQASMWRSSLPFIASVIELRSYWILRSISGLMLVVSHVMLLYNMWMTMREERALTGKPALSTP